MRFDWKKWIPNLVILCIFFIAAAIYFYPALFEGKIVYAGDNINGTAACHEGNQWKAEHPEGTWWTGAIFSGMPNIQMGGHADYMIDKIMKPFVWFFSWGNRNTFFIFLFYLCAFYLLLRAFDVDKWISMAGAFAISLSSYFFVIIAAQHHGKCFSITWMVLAVVGFLLIYRKQYGWGAIITAFFTYIGFFLHPQMSYYICMMMGIFFFAEIARAAQANDWKHLGIATLIFFASFGVGFGMGSANIFATQEYTAETMRGGHSDISKETDEGNKTAGLDLDYATAWSEGIDESMTFLIPNYMGGASGYDLGKDSPLEKELKKMGVPGKDAKHFCQSAPTYWGDKAFTSGPVYMGAIVCFLFLLGLILVDNKNPYKWAILAATLFSVFLSWGRHFMPLTELFFNYFPMYNKFRAVESILIVAEITVPLLGFLALKEITDGQKEKKAVLRGIGIAGGLTALVCIIVMMMSGSIDATSTYDSQWKGQVGDRIYEAIVDQRRAMIFADAQRSLIFIILAVAAVILYVMKRYDKPNEKTKWNIIFGSILTLLIVGDMWAVDKRFCNDSNFVSIKDRDKAFKMKDYEKQLLEDESYFRVLNLATNTFNDARTSYYLKSIGGYSAAKMRRYQDLIDEHISKEINPFYQAYSSSYGFQLPCDGTRLFPVINMLNGKYIILPMQDGKEMPALNPFAFGNCWLVDSLVMVNNANEESAALNLYDLRHVAVCDKTFEPNSGLGSNDDVFGSTTSGDTIYCLGYEPNRLQYRSSTQSERFAVFSEIYYPHGWKVTIDGSSTDLYRVNYMLRAIRIPAGNHEICFVFEPDSIRKGNILAMICFGIFLLTLIGVIGKQLYDCKRQTHKS